jgi:uncharacterized phage protein gp47/JayE
MPLTAPATAREVVERALNDVQQAMTAAGAKPFVRRSWLRNLITAFGNRVFDFYFALNREIDEVLPDTAIRNLERWAAVFGVLRTAGLRSNGTAWVLGNNGAAVNVDQVLVDGTGQAYLTTSSGTIASVVLSAISITRVGQVATLTTTIPHGLGLNALITVAGAGQIEYNVMGATILSIPSANTLTYAVTGSPVTPATGAVTLSTAGASVSVRSNDFSADTDQDTGSVLTFESPQAGLFDSVSVVFPGLTGGSDQETDESLRERLLDRIQNPVAHFNVAEITARARTIPGVTRVFVFEITPAVGQVTVYFTRDNDVDPIPDAAEVAEVAAAIQAIRPATTAPGDVIVAAPVPVPVTFNFTAISPSTSSMKNAVTESLRQFFAERTQVGQPVTVDQYRTAIFATVDPATGQRLLSFTLSTPTGTVGVTSGQLATLGLVTFP